MIIYIYITLWLAFHTVTSVQTIQVLFWTLFNVAFRRNKDVNPTRKVCMVQFTVSSLDRLPLLYTWRCAWVHERGVCVGVTVCYTGHIIRYSIHQTYTEEHHVICLLKLSSNYLTENSLTKAHVLCRLTCHESHAVTNLMLSQSLMLSQIACCHKSHALTCTSSWHTVLHQHGQLLQQ